MSGSPIACRACGGRSLDLVLSLGTMPLANALLSAAELGRPEPVFPLDLAFCAGCSLVQITETVAPEELFREYAYFSSFSDTMLAHAERLVERVVRERRLGPPASPDSLALEVASNDGYLLQFYKRAGVSVLGIEPARNVAKVAVEQRGVPTLTEFFGADLAERLAAQGKRADVLHANNVLAHVADLNGFVAGVRAVLKGDAVAILEVPYVRDMIERVEFDTIYHEHLCYFSLSALAALFRRHDLAIVDVERHPIHGGSLRLFAAPAGRASPRASVAAMLEEEERIGLTQARYYEDFARRVEALKRELLGVIGQLVAEGKRIAAYGAAAKGSTLLNYFGIGRDVIEFVADRNTYKQGRLMPGVRIPVVAPEALIERMPDYTLLLTWNFADEILAQQAHYRAKGGKFILPLPSVRVV